MTVISGEDDTKPTLDSVLGNKVLIALPNNSEDPHEVFTYLSAQRSNGNAPYRAADRKPNSSDIVYIRVDC